MKGEGMVQPISSHAFLVGLPTRFFSAENGMVSSWPPAGPVGSIDISISSLVDCSVDNLGSDKTIQVLGGVLERREVDPSDNNLTNVYWIDTKEAIGKYYDVYSKYIDASQKVK